MILGAETRAVGAASRGTPPDNGRIAAALEQVADLLEGEGTGRFRVEAYRRGAAALRALHRPVAALMAEGGLEEVEALPGIGQGLAAAIGELVRTGRLRLLERLEARISPEGALSTIPGIGPVLARRIHEALGVETLEELELAAFDGRLAGLRGFGPRRLEGIRSALAARLSRSLQRGGARLEALLRRAGSASGSGEAAGASAAGDGGASADRPRVELLLAVDAEYRTKAEAGELPSIAPHRLNPTGEAWLPILRVTRDGWRVQAMYSNTARAHRLGRTHDWVVLYYARNGVQGQATVITAGAGALRGRRVVAGREAECRAVTEHARIGGRDAGSAAPGSTGTL